MRSIGLIILITVAFTWAESPPRVMLIHMKDSTASVYCSRLDPDVGVTFVDNNMQMKVGIRDIVEPVADPANPVYVQSILFFCVSQIDSITFVDLVAATAPAPALTKRPAPSNHHSAKRVAFKNSGIKATR